MSLPPKKRVRLPVIAEVERQLDRQGLWSHAMLTETLDRMHDLATWVFAGLEAMMERGVITSDELAAIRARVREKLEARHWSQQVGFALNASDDDKYKAQTAVIDCDARMELCQGVCCWMDHPLQVADIAEGVVAWDHGKPYWIRQTSHGQCVHQEPTTGRCGVFERRPLICRTYDCRDDKRVWKDFAARIPNSETIGQILDGSYFELVGDELMDPATKVAIKKVQVDPTTP